MRAQALIEVWQGGELRGEHRLGHGALVGRLATAALQLDDERVSEAHALLSLREGGLMLLALRRRFTHNGARVSELRLRAGQQIELCDGLELRVRSVQLPTAVLGLSWDGHPGQPLLHGSASLCTQPTPRLSWRHDPAAPVQLWRIGEAWRARIGSEAPRDLQPGSVLSVDGIDVHAVTVPLEAAGGEATRGVSESLHLIAFYDTIHIQRRGCPVTVIAGQGARLVSELIATGVPLTWREAAHLLWTDDADEHALRNRLDAVVRRLRRKLAEYQIRDDLVSPDGTGHLELRLQPGDTVDDRT